jgi:hypothetical protein
MLRRQIASLVARSWAASADGAAPAMMRAFADDANLQKTVLYDLHVANGGE